MTRFKAIEVDPATRQRTGREHTFDATSRDGAIDALLGALGITREQVHIDPSRTLVEVSNQRWTIVAVAASETTPVPPSLRRAGAKHKRVR